MLILLNIKRKFDHVFACLFMCLLFNILPMVMHMHIKLMNIFRNWLLSNVHIASRADYTCIVTVS